MILYLPTYNFYLFATILSSSMKLLLLANIIFFASVANACGPLVRSVFFPPPPPPPTYYTCQRVSNGPPCVGSTVATCTCTNGATATSCPNDQNYYYYSGAMYCYDNNYNGYVTCTCAAGTWTPNYSYYQVAVNSNGGISYNGFYGYGKKKK